MIEHMKCRTRPESGFGGLAKNCRANAEVIWNLAWPRVMTSDASIVSALPAPSAPKDQCLNVHVFRVEEGLGNACLLQLPDQSCGILDWGTQRPEPLERALEIAKKGGSRLARARRSH